MKTPIHVLLLEDDAALNTALTEFFTLKNFKVTSVHGGLEAIEEIEKQKFNLFIIDINVPDINGLEILRQIRRVDLDTPVVIITASLEVENFATAFAYGCNEYIKKPFHFKELDIRIGQLLSLPKIEQIQVHKDFFYDLSLQTFIYKKKAIDLSHKEKRFCALLMKYPNTYVSTEQIHDYVWEGKTKENYPLRQLIVKLRKKLPYDVIETKIKTGYRIRIFS
ncbi:MAG TPA: response regulator transcription factor [Epsilonproteobacteria bacterium]|nr:response regulator transcription factor [Campylobacterota bacterium]